MSVMTEIATTREAATTDKAINMTAITSEITYTLQGDYLLPNIGIQRTPQSLGKYGMMRKQYLQQHRPILYAQLTLTEQLLPHCLEIEEMANQRLKAQAEQVILTELIYS